MVAELLLRVFIMDGEASVMIRLEVDGLLDDLVGTWVSDVVKSCGVGCRLGSARGGRSLGGSFLVGGLGFALEDEGLDVLPLVLPFARLLVMVAQFLGVALSTSSRRLGSSA